MTECRSAVPKSVCRGFKENKTTKQSAANHLKCRVQVVLQVLKIFSLIRSNLVLGGRKTTNKKSLLNKMHFIRLLRSTANALIMVEGYGVSWVAEYCLLIKPALLASPLCLPPPPISPGRHSRISQVAYLLVSLCNFSSAALQPDLTDDWLVALHSSPVIMLKWSHQDTLPISRRNVWRWNRD